MDNNELNPKRSHYPPKSYKITTFSFYVLKACLSVFGEQKDQLLFTLLGEGESFDVERIKSLPTLSKYSFVEDILTDLQEMNASFTELSSYFHSDKNQSLRDVFTKYEIDKDSLTIEHVRILPSYQEFIKTFAGENRYGLTIELALAIFIENLSDFEFHLIQVVLEKMLIQATEQPDLSDEATDIRRKTYILDRFFAKLFDVCADLYGLSNKKAKLVKVVPGLELKKISRLPKLKQGDLLEKMLEDLKESSLSYDEIMEHKNLQDLQSLYEKQNKNPDDKYQQKSFALTHDIHDFIDHYSKNKKMTIQLAIALFVSQRPKSEQKIIYEALPAYLE